MHNLAIPSPALPATSYIPDHPAIRSLADWQADRIARFVARHPEYARLSPDVLLQYAETYRDDADHALEQEFRDNGVLTGCRADYAARKDEDDPMPHPDGEPFYGRWEAS